MYLIEDDIIIEPVVVGVVVLHIVLLGFKTLLEQVIDETTLGLNLGVDRIIDLVQSTSLRSLEQSIQSRNRSEQRGTKSLHIIKNVVGRALRCSRRRGASYLEEADTSTVDENGIIEKTLEDVSEGEVREVAIRLVAGDARQQAAAQRSHGHTMGVESSLVPSRERETRTYLGLARGTGGVADGVDIIRTGRNGSHAVLATDLFDLSDTV